MPQNTTIFKTEMSQLIASRQPTIDPDKLHINEWPSTIINSILTQAKAAASIQCSIRNADRDLAIYDTHIKNGTIPKDLEYVFKKLYTSEADISFKTAMLEQAIKAEISRVTLKKANLVALDTARLESLSTSIKEVVRACDLNIDTDTIKLVFEHQITQWKAEFITKQVSSDLKKAAKQASFTLVKEKSNNPAVITAKELKALNNTITALNKKVAHLTVKAPSKKATGSKKRVNPAPKKPTGATREKDGKPRASVKAKRSAGKNGN